MGDPFAAAAFTTHPLTHSLPPIMVLSGSKIGALFNTASTLPRITSTRTHRESISEVPNVHVHIIKSEDGDKWRIRGMRGG